MEVYRYILEVYLNGIRESGAMRPKYDLVWDRTCINGIPVDPLAWGIERTYLLISLIRQGSGDPNSRISLIHFAVDPKDPDLFVEEDWSSYKNPRPLSEYRRELYKLPKVIIPYSIPSEQIYQTHLSPELIKRGVVEAKYI